MSPARVLLVASLFSVASPLARDAGAQIRASERGTVSQTVDGTIITVDYGRAQARGRDSLFGKVVTKDEMWTPGANAATTLEISRDVTISGTPVPAGKYSMWLVSDPAAEWVLYLHKNTAFWHTAHPKPATMAFSFPVKHTTTGEHVEILTFDFPRVSPMHAELRLRWGTTTVPMDIGITPSAPKIAMTAEQLAPYLGTYAVTVHGPNGRKSPELKLLIVNAKGALRGIIDQPGGEPTELEYLPTTTPHQFMPAFLKDGKIFDVEVMPLDFQVVDGRATGFVVTLDRKPWMEAKRKS